MTRLSICLLLGYYVNVEWALWLFFCLVVVWPMLNPLMRVDKEDLY